MQLEVENIILDFLMTRASPESAPNRLETLSLVNLPPKEIHNRNLLIDAHAAKLATPNQTNGNGDTTSKDKLSSRLAEVAGLDVVFHGVDGEGQGIFTQVEPVEPKPDSKKSDVFVTLLRVPTDEFNLPGVVVDFLTAEQESRAGVGLFNAFRNVKRNFPANGKKADIYSSGPGKRTPYYQNGHRTIN